MYISIGSLEHNLRESREEIAVVREENIIGLNSKRNLEKGLEHM